MSTIIGFLSLAIAWGVSSALVESLSKARARMVGAALLAFAFALIGVGVSLEAGGLALDLMRVAVLLTFWSGALTIGRSFRHQSTDETSAAPRVSR